MYVNFNKEREENTMKYETPELTALTPAIEAIQAGTSKNSTHPVDGQVDNEAIGAYADWE
jgi:hypothetical protein